MHRSTDRLHCSASPLGGLARLVTPSATLKAAALLAAILSAGSFLPAATIPFSNDFSSTGFTNQTSGKFSLSSGTLVNAVSGTTAIVSAASEQFSGLTNRSFATAMDLSYTSAAVLPGGVSTTAGFAVFGQDALFSGSGNPYILAGVNVYGTGSGSAAPGSVFLQAVGTGYTLTTTSATAIGGNLTLNTAYSLKLQVVNTSPNNYTLTLGLYDGGGLLGSSVTASLIVTAEPGGGYFMGLRTRNPFNGTSSGTSTLVFDNYSVSAIPEPASYGMLAGAGFLLLTVVRRRRVRG